MAVRVGTIADVATALAAQPMRTGTEPGPTTVGRYDAFSVEPTVPDGTDVDACPGGRTEDA